MTSRPGHHRKGSVIVMVVGLLVMLAMVGMTFVIVAHMDRREAQSIATAAPMKQVASGVLQRILVERGVVDLYIDDKGTADPNDDVIYGSAVNYKQQVEHPHEDYDKALASFAPVDVGGGTLVWRHLSNLPGDLTDVVQNVRADGFILEGTYANQFIKDIVDAGGNKLYEWVDTDGCRNDGTNSEDAISYFSGVTDRAGRKCFVAVRIIPASTLVNANSAYSPSAAAAGVAMPVTNVSLWALTNQAARDRVHNARNGSTTDDITTYNANYVQRPLNPAVNTYEPFDPGDFLAVLWSGTPNTATGRLYEALGDQFDNARPYLTVFSASRIFPRRGVKDNLAQTYKFDLNRADATPAHFNEAFTAFYNAIPAGIVGFSDGDNHRKTAAQLAVNAIDFRDTNNNVTFQAVPGVGGTNVYGIERQPFVTELFYKVYMDASMVPSRYSAIELFNPYSTALNLTGFRLTEGGTEKTPTGGWAGKSVPARGRVVIVSSAITIPVPGGVTAIEILGLNLSKGVRIYRSRNSDGSGLKDVLLADVTLSVDNPAPNSANCRVHQWDDRLSTARYAIDDTVPLKTIDYTNENGGLMDAATTNLGRANPLANISGLTSEPCPIYVRNGNFINVGELNRIFYVGPSDTKSLSAMLTATSAVSNGRLDLTSGIAAVATWDPDRIPRVPMGCLLSDYLMVASPMNDGIDNDGDGQTDAADNNGGEDIYYGGINPNIAPAEVLACLPALANLSGADRMRIAREIVAYRDLLDNTADGGTNYSAGRDAATSISDLRNEPGFACPGEIAIPIYIRGSRGDIAAAGRLPQNAYSPGNASPRNYSLCGVNDDDGLSSTGANKVDNGLVKHHVYYAWLSNCVTVRSDVYIAYIRVDLRTAIDQPSQATRKYVAVIDRSNCRSAGDMPRVLMFAEMK